MREWRLGILGGMGPLATVDIMRKLLAATAADSDQEQIPVVAWNVPQIPDRQKALAGQGESPLAAMRQGVRALNTLGVSHIVIPCNTAHHWHSDLSAVSLAPILHLIELTVDAIKALPAVPPSVGVIATHGTLATQLYQQRLNALGISVVEPTDDELTALFVPGCYAVKQGQLEKGGSLLAALAERLVARGAAHLVLACTEVPIALEAVGHLDTWPVTDPSEVLAIHCAREWCRHREELAAQKLKEVRL